MYRVAVFSCQPYDQTYLSQNNHAEEVEFTFIPSRLTHQTAPLAATFDAICVFVNDVLDKACLDILHSLGVKHIALRCAGFNNVDLEYAATLNLHVSRVPAYSPEAVAEHTMALILSLNRHIHKAYNRVRENNFSLLGLTGFNLYKKTVGVIGTGKIGSALCRILNGFSCEILCYDTIQSDCITAMGCKYVSLRDIWEHADIISLHCPLNEQTSHMINARSLQQMKDGVMLINTSRGGLIDTKALIAALKSRKIGFLGLDVYEMESELFFEDHSMEIPSDDLFDRLAGFPNVLITGHQGFFTHEALQEIATTTLSNIENARLGRYPDTTFLC
ncbi:2-hydroxyacid dehydrogenase [Aestuariibacter sp. AA17]|uniref:2-hydroxyacid dehydrogenase n=1 Tax=Fluctibacter corallii TaxID=2984329 RepID=A0ABT3A9K6_9ALTE|nr:2-hydroxyacid dehydrogenase [Aestuariibacter sp. AA17]MCV2885356.1 2-hydroxyacid dehydrogenase [Aestuariibacter sp. AA17]